METDKIKLNGAESFDGIIERIVIEYNVKTTTIIVKQWDQNTYALSELKFNGVVFQSLPDISLFNLINEITIGKDAESIINQLDEYLKDNPTLMLSTDHDNIRNAIKRERNLSSYFFTSPYCKDWFIVCKEMFLSEKIN